MCTSPRKVDKQLREKYNKKWRQPMTQERRKYSKEFKIEAIRMLENGGKPLAEIERDLGISKGLLWKWKESFRRQPRQEEAFPGNGRLTETEARIRQLERENAMLKQDKEILKKVLVMYSKENN
jgi:transposase-like protein